MTAVVFLVSSQKIVRLYLVSALKEIGTTDFKCIGVIIVRNEGVTAHPPTAQDLGICAFQGDVG